MTKKQNTLLKVITSMLVVACIGIGVYISANATPTEDDFIDSMYYYDYNDENELLEDVETELVEIPSNLGFIPRLAQSNHQNRIILFNHDTGDVVASYSFSEYERIYGAIETGTGYYIVHVGEDDLFSYQLRTGMLDYIWEMEEEEKNAYITENFPEIPESERNFRIIVFDKNLNIVETFPGETDENHLKLWGSVATFENGELIIYDTLSIPGEVGESFGTFSIVPAHVRRLNLTTGEIDILFEVENSMHLMKFIGERYVLVERVVNVGVTVAGMRESVLNLETGELFDLSIDVLLEGEDVVSSHLELMGVSLESWVSFGNSLDYMETSIWDTELIEYFGISLNPRNFEILSARGIYHTVGGFYFFSEAILVE